MSARSPSSDPSVAVGGSQTSKLRLPANCDPPGENNPPKQAVWIVFGASGHIGRSLVRAALAHGDIVTAVGHMAENTKEQMEGWHRLCLGLLCDVRLRETVQHVVQETIERWGRIDIIANCTGYGVVAAAEDQSYHDVMNQFMTNFIGTLHILQQSLPYFRENSIPGRYLIFSSTAGALGVPGLAPYCATKYAVEGLIESMLYETDCFNIKATLVEPGHMRQDDGDEDMGENSGKNTKQVHAADSSQTAKPNYTSGSLPKTATAQFQQDPLVYRRRYGHFVIKPTASQPYSSPHSPAGHAKRLFQWLNMRQPTSVVRSAELLWQLGHCAYPPLRLLLGTYAVESIRDRLRSVTEEIEDWKYLNFQEVSASADISVNGEDDGDRRDSVVTVGEGKDDIAEKDEHDDENEEHGDTEMVDADDDHR